MMIWLIAGTSGWAVLAVLLGLLVGNGIRLERGREALPAPADAAPEPSAPPSPSTVVAADTVDDVVAAAAG